MIFSPALFLITLSGALLSVSAQDNRMARIIKRDASVDLKNDALSAHNSFRAQHGAPNMTWDDEAASKAQEWADGCVFEHSGGQLGAFGENIAAGQSDITQAIKDWTDEVKDYDPTKPEASHFTQVVWKASTKLGCAVASCNMPNLNDHGNSDFFVCEYSPAGNVYPAENFDQNVQK